MSKSKEAFISVNGQALNEGQSMTIRVALESFAMSLKSDGLGDDTHGKNMVNLYLHAIDSIRKIMYR
jgi:hypothetical protein